MCAAVGGECGVPTMRRYYTPVMGAPDPVTAADSGGESVVGGQGGGGSSSGNSGSGSGGAKAPPALCYSFDRGSVHFVMMDSEMPSAPESAQGR